MNIAMQMIKGKKGLLDLFSLCWISWEHGVRRNTVSDLQPIKLSSANPRFRRLLAPKANITYTPCYSPLLFFAFPLLPIRHFPRNCACQRQQGGQKQTAGPTALEDLVPSLFSACLAFRIRRRNWPTAWRGRTFNRTLVIEYWECGISFSITSWGF